MYMLIWRVVPWPIHDYSFLNTWFHHRVYVLFIWPWPIYLIQCKFGCNYYTHFTKYVNTGLFAFLGFSWWLACLSFGMNCIDLFLERRIKIKLAFTPGVRQHSTRTNRTDGIHLFAWWLHNNMGWWNYFWCISFNCQVIYSQWMNINIWPNTHMNTHAYSMYSCLLWSCVIMHIRHTRPYW